MERFSDVETNWLRDLGRPRRSRLPWRWSRARRRPRRPRPAEPAGQASSDAPQQPAASPAAAPVTTGAIPPLPAVASTPQPGPPPASVEPPSTPPPAATAQPPAAPPAPAAQQPAAPPSTATAQPPAPPPPAAAPAAPPPAASEQPPPATPTAAEPPPPPPVDPVLAEVRRQLAEPAKGNVDRADRAALAAFYAARNEPLLWVTGDGFTAKARHAMAEIRKADDWGLSASAFELPQLAQGTAAPDALAGAEIKLGLAALKYARHARGGRLDPDADQQGYRRQARPSAIPRSCWRPWPPARRPATTCATSIPSTSSSRSCARRC